MYGRKGYYFTLDAIFGLLLIMTGLSLFSYLYSAEVDTDSLEHYSNDIINILSQVTVDEINNSYITQLIDDGIINPGNISLLEQIGHLYVSGLDEEANLLFHNLTHGLVPESFSYGIWINDEEVYVKNSTRPRQIFTAKHAISGIEQGKPITGLSSRALLSGINSMSSSSYIYFGGYVGDGNITAELELPSDISNISSCYIELDAASDFIMYINGAYAGHYNISDSNISFTADSWSMNTSYLSNFHAGTNQLKLVFNDSAYVGGGYLKVRYVTSELGTYLESGRHRYMFPGIEGIINIYDAFYVPGIINHMNVTLHFLTNTPLYLNIGNNTVRQFNASPSVQTVQLNNSYLDSLLDYTFLSKKTVPLRLGLTNITYSYGGKSDAVLITDRTGSMDACDVDISCTEPGICDTSDGGDGDPCQERRDKVAQSSDRTFIDEMLWLSGNSVGLVGYGKRTNPVCSFHDLTGDNTSLQTRIDDYYNEWCGYTCISCGIQGATELLVENKVLYDTTVQQSINTTEFHLGDSGELYVREIHNMIINKSRFVRGRLSVMGRSVDTGDGYRDCVYFNEHYVGRMCESNDNGDTGWHTCTFPLKRDWFYSPDKSESVWTMTSEADFLTGTIENLDIYKSSGDMYLNNNTLYTYTILSDNFDDDDISEYSSSGGNWFTDSEAGKGYVLRQTQNANTVIYQPEYIVSSEKYVIKASIYNNEDDPIGIAFRIDPLDPTSLYSCSADDRGSFDAGIWRHDSDIIGTPSQLLAGTSFSYTPGVWYNVTITVDENANTINCVWESAGVDFNVTATDDDSWESGYIGVWGSRARDIKVDLLEAKNYSGFMGIFLSPVFDTTLIANWTFFNISRTVPAGTNLTVDVRTGNIEVPDTTWDNYYWTDDPYLDAYNNISQNYARYIQYRVTFESDNSSQAVPVLHHTMLGYVPDAGKNEVKVTGSNTYGCLNTTGEQDDWDVKNIDLKVWSSDDVYYNSFADATETEIGDDCGGCSLSDTTVFATGLDTTKIRAGFLEFEAVDVDPDYYDCVFVNDHYIGRVDYQKWSGDNIWQNISFDVPVASLNDSDITIKITSGTIYGCELSSDENDDWSFRNINLTIITTADSGSYDRYMSMLIMSDGEANTKIGHRRSYDSTNADDEAIAKACEAYDQFGIRIYSVAFGDGADTTAMQDIACCDDCDNFYTASNAEELAEIYSQIANRIIDFQFSEQTSNVTGNVTTVLYPDSRIDFNYTPENPAQEYQRIPVTVDGDRFDNNISQGSFYVPQNITVYNARVTSYSGNRWTSLAYFNSSGVWSPFFNLSEYGQDYYTLGDPYTIEIPVALMGAGYNTVKVHTALSPGNASIGSPDDRIIYTLGVPIAINYSGVFAKAEGCTWYIEYDDGSSSTMDIPLDYNGSEYCYYKSDGGIPDIQFNETDAVSNAVYQLFTQLDLDNDGRLFINFLETDVTIETTLVRNIPYMWGPTIIEVRAWQ